jgi:hypothetical protein
MSGKIFTSEPPSHIRIAPYLRHVDRIDQKRTRACELALEGKYYLAIALFREAFEGESFMPDDRTPHELFLKELRDRIELDFERRTCLMLSEHVAETDRVVDLAEKRVRRVQMKNLNDELIRNVVVVADGTATLRTASIWIESMCEEGIALEHLLGIEDLFKRSFGTH